VKPVEPAPSVMPSRQD